MRYLALSLVLGVGALCVLTTDQSIFSPVVLGAAGEQNAYFESLTRRPEHWKSYSLRSQAEIDKYSGGPNEYVTYDAAMDAAKTVIEAFIYNYQLTAPVSASDDRITLREFNPDLFIKDRAIKIDNEIMVVHQPAKSGSQFPDGRGTTTVLVKRGTYGTAAATHSTGTLVQLSANSLRKQVRVPIDSTDGHGYFVTWDALFTESYLGVAKMGGQKAFQLADQSTSKIWLETRTRLDGKDGFGKAKSSNNLYPGFDPAKHVAVIDVRSYNTSLPTAEGSNMIQAASLQPQSGRFLVYPNRWVRFFWYVDQRADALDPVSLWVADELTDPVRVIDGVTVSVRGTPSTIKEWYLELNTSYDRYRGKTDPMIAYVRNVAVLRDAKPTDFLQRPVAGSSRRADAPPSAPRNVRILP